MRGIRTWAAGVGGFVLAATGAAQTPPPATPGMPGTPVGKPIVVPVGIPIPRAAPAAGERVGTGPGGLPPALSPQQPQMPGQQIDLKNVIAPYPQQPTPEPTFWEKLEERWFSLFKSSNPTVPPPNWTPGIGRRNRERAEERRQRPWWMN